MPITYLLLAQQAAQTSARDGLDRATLIVGVLAVLVAAGTALLVSRDAARDRRASHKHALARQYAEALAAAIEWGEVPYRVARRTSDDPATLQLHVLHVHDLQERLIFHSQWLRVESPDIADAYDSLVKAIKDHTMPNVRDAWTQAPRTKGSDMNLGGPIYPCDVTKECQVFVAAVRRRLYPDAKETP